MNMYEWKQAYYFDPEFAVWRRPKPDAFTYTDGDHAEKRLLDILKQAKDLRTLSDELIEQQEDWMLTYHLSSKRANLLRPLEHKIKNTRILELGCGCGAITRYLGELAEEVLAVEGSPQRAAAAALRCRDLENVCIVSDNIQGLDLPPASYDIVTLIGVLEYARVYDSDPEPELRMLQKACSFLKPEGILILAIENKLGLKYFAGVPEDHIGGSWSGITDTYSQNSPATFSRLKMLQLLEQAGFAQATQYVAVPDYKLPVSVILPAGLSLPKEEFRRSELMRNSQRPYEEPALFSLYRAWEEIDKAGLFQEMADSLCFVAAASEIAEPVFSPEILALHYGQLEKRHLAKEVSFLQTPGGIIVRRRLLEENAEASASKEKKTHLLETEPYFPDETLHYRISSILNRPNWTEEEVGKCIQPWLDWLKDHVDADGFLPEEFIDATPFNILLKKSGEVYYFDREWVLPEQRLSLPVVALRGLVISFSMLTEIFTHTQENDPPQLIIPLCARILKAGGIDVNDREIEETLTIMQLILKGAGFVVPTDFVELFMQRELPFLANFPSLYSRIVHRDRLFSAHYEELKTKMQSEYDFLQGQHNHMQRHRDLLQEHSDALEVSRDELQVRCDNIQKQWDLLQEHCEALEVSRDELQVRYDNIQRHRDLLQEHSEGLEISRDNLQVRHDNMQIHRDRLQEHCDALEAVRDDLQIRLEILQEHCNALEASGDDLQVRHDNMQIHRDRLQEHCNALEASRDDLQVRHDNMQTHRDRLQEHCDGLEVRRYELQAELDRTKTALHAVHSSRSWRITRPVRFFTRGLRSLRSGVYRVLGVGRVAIKPEEQVTLPSIHMNHGSETSTQGSAVTSVVQRANPSPLSSVMQQTGATGQLSVLENAEPSLLSSATQQAVGKGELPILENILINRPKAEPPKPFPAFTPDVKAIAFYLPQFHPIPENDEWWGEGFTEWTNVSKAAPFFQGHYQPRRPGALGFYDLRLAEIMRKQIQLAKEFGLYGFCFHYYWFGGKRLLERPLEQFLEDPSLDMPFCVCWANENWTRCWDGYDKDILIAQQHSEEDDEAMIRDVHRYFKDPRYIRINDRPIFIVYQASLLPDIKATLGRWKAYFDSQSEPHPFFIMAQSFGNYDPKVLGFDAAVQFPPHLPGSYFPDLETPYLVDDFSVRLVPYDTAMKRCIDHYNPDLPSFPCVFPDWDNTARRGETGTVFVGASPEKYASWLVSVGKKVQKDYPPECRFVFINAWNEWAEGAYLEPDKAYGYAYLNATSRALALLSKEAGEKKPVPVMNSEHRLRVLFISHDAYRAGAQVLLLHSLKWFKQHTAVEAFLLCLSEGELLPDFEACCPVWLCADDKVSLEELHEFCPNPDIVCGNTALSASCYDTVSKLNVPIITYVHEMEKSLQKFVGPENIAKMKSFSTSYIVASGPIKDNLVNNHDVDKDKIKVINAFITPRNIPSPASKPALRQYLGLPTDAFIVLGCGSRDWRKGPDLFVQVADYVLQNTQKPVHFCWLGEGEDPNISRPQSLAEDLGIAQHVSFPGHISTPENFFQVADLFLLTSREDPFPLVVLEACDKSIPVICFDLSGGMPDFVRTGVGFVVPYENVQAMADKTLELLNNEQERFSLKRSARSRLLESHVVDIAVPHFLQILRETAGKPHPVSVIVPNYNYADYLPERMESIFNQTFKDLEIIILDDASTDDSLEVLKKWEKRASVRIFANSVNSGNVCKQWKKGLEQAKGEFIWIAEADDLCSPDFLSTLLGPMQDPEVNIAYSIPSIIDEAGSPVDLDYRQNYLAFASPSRWQESYVIDGDSEVCEAMGIVNCIPNVSAILFRKPRDLSIFDAVCEFRYSGDWLFYLLMLQNGKVAYVHGDIAKHRRHEKSVIAKDQQRKMVNLREEAERIHEWVCTSSSVPESSQKKMRAFTESIGK